MTLSGGTVVWAKLASYPYWPARIIELEELSEDVRDALPDPCSDHELVWFFGSNNCNYVPRTQIELWDEGFEQRTNSKKGKQQKAWNKALKEAQTWLEKTKSKSKNPEKDFPSKKKRIKEQEDSGIQRNKKDSKIQKDKEKSKPNSSEDEEPTFKKKRNSVELTKESSKKTKYEVSSEEIVKLTPGAVSESLRSIQNHPVAKYFKFEITKTTEGTATAKTFIPDKRFTKEEVHSSLGAIHFLLDITAYAACASVISESNSGLTQAVTFNVLSPNLTLGSELTLKANVLPSKSPGFLFVSVEAIANGRQIIVGTITKTTNEYNFPIKNNKE
jgi:hypothetical protein